VKRVALGAALLFWATACATPTPFHPLPAEDPRPQQLIDRWVESASQRHGLRGLARLAVDRDDGSVRLRGKQLVILERPSRLRVEILGFLNQSLAVIATDGAGFEVYRAEDQSYETGDVDDRLLWNEAGIDLSPEEAVAVLLGVPISEPIHALAGAVRDGEGRIRVDLATPDGRVVERATFDVDGNLYALEALDRSGDVAWVAHFGGYRVVEGVSFAHSIDLDVRSGMTRAEILFRKIELNPELSPEMFHLIPAAGGDGLGHP
jgi:hypothetical protein